MNPRELFILVSIALLAAISGIYIVWQPIIWSLIVIGPITILGYADIFQKKHTIKRNFITFFLPKNNAKSNLFYARY